MKKIMLLLFLFLMCYACYYIYNLTEKTKLYVTSIGDIISKDNYLKYSPTIEKYNTIFVNKDNRIIDILNTLKYNKEIIVSDKSISIHQIIKKSDIIIISVGMNDIYYKIESNSKEIYTYINNMLKNYEEILKIINKYNNKKVIILGYYNIYNNKNDIFTYANYKLKKIASNNNNTFIDLNKEFHNKEEYLQKKDKYYLNNKGIEQINKFIVEKIKNN